MGKFTSALKGLAKAATGKGGKGDPPSPPMSAAKPAGSAVAPCPIKAAADCPGVLSDAAQTRANKKYDTLKPAEKQTFKIALNAAQSPCERAYIWKAFAACHTPDECLAFGQRIGGRSHDWMQDNLSLTGDTTGHGVQQQWSHSCNATTAQAVRGQVDPVYALDTHEANPNWGKVDGTDATKQNPHLAEEQRAMLTSTYHGKAAGDHAGVAVGRSQAGGGGRWADDLFNANSDATGVTYKTKKGPADPATDIDGGLATGAPVPIVIGNAPGEYTHYVLVTGSHAGPPKSYTIHDPWDGVTVSRTEDQVKNGQINLAGSNKVTAVEVPTPLKKPARRAPC